LGADRLHKEFVLVWPAWLARALPAGSRRADVYLQPE